MCENTFERAHPGVNTNAIYQMIYLRKRGGNFVKYFDAIAFVSVYTYIASFQTKIFVCSIRKLMEYFEFLSIPRFVTMIQGKYLIYLVSEQIFFLNYFSHWFLFFALLLGSSSNWKNSFQFFLLMIEQDKINKDTFP